MKSVAIIGMNYGDEGKGHITNYFSSKDTLNIRFNGGAQAAHGVFLSDNRNHIFHHFGSGSLNGARTLLANRFIINPILFDQELEELTKKAPIREIFIDPRCRVSTHYDMLINSFSAKYHKKNNTCGIGINEAIERSKYRQLRIGMRDVIEKSETELNLILKKIEHEYVPYRIEELKLPFHDFKNYCAKRIRQPKKIMNSYLQTLLAMRNYIVVWPDDNLIDKFLAKDHNRHLVFEGAQGMLLDQNRTKYMPFLTRSNTGLKNVFDILRTVRTSIELDVYLITRAYLTRHGEGPLFNEKDKPYDGINEFSNPENPYQGKMRYGFLNKVWYDQAIQETCGFGKKKRSCLKSFRIGVAMNCIDHIDKNLLYSNGSKKLIEGSINDFDKIKIKSVGPTEKDIKNNFT